MSCGKRGVTIRKTGRTAKTHNTDIAGFFMIGKDKGEAYEKWGT